MSRTPKRYQGSDITRAGALLDQAAAHPDENVKRDLFNQAWTIALPQIRLIVRKVLNGDRTTDTFHDAIEYTARKTWRSVQTGYKPDAGYEATLATNPVKATITTLERERKHRDNPMLHVDMRYDPDDEREHWLAHDDPSLEAVHDTMAQQALRRQLDRAANRARLLQHPIAAELLKRGLSGTTGDVATQLDVPARQVNTELEWIRENRYALMQASDRRFREELQQRFVERIEGRQHAMVISA